MKRLLKFVLELMLVSAVLGALGRALSKKYTEGDAASDEFAIAVFFGGVERASTAAALRRGRVAICFGGVDLDLRKATLDPAGTELDVKVCFGGIRVTVPDGWRVTVTEDARAAGVDVAVTDPDDLPDDAPRLELTVMARMGGVSISAGRQPGEADQG